MSSNSLKRALFDNNSIYMLILIFTIAGRVGKILEKGCAGRQ